MKNKIKVYTEVSSFYRSGEWSDGREGLFVLPTYLLFIKQTNNEFNRQRARQSGSNLVSRP